MVLSELICGRGNAPGVANATLVHLSGSIDRFAAKALKYLNNNKFSEEAKNFGAFSARVVLENSCAALVGRFDPFRLVYLAEFQAQEDFEHGRPTKSGFRWTGDVVPDAAVKLPENMWGPDHDVSKISRALLSDYAGHVHWRPAFERTLDAISAESDQAAFKELVLLEPKNYLGFARGKCATLYSTLSKGVHWDFFVSTVVLDEGTIKDTIRDCFLSLAGMGLVSHFVPTAYRSLKAQAALKAYKRFRSTFQ